MTFPRNRAGRLPNKRRPDEPAPTAHEIVRRISKRQSFDSLNSLLVSVRLSDFHGDDRLAVEAAIDHQRDLIVKIAHTP